jgi:hypothetical protein
MSKSSPTALRTVARQRAPSRGIGGNHLVVLDGDEAGLGGREALLLGAQEILDRVADVGVEAYSTAGGFIVP